MRFIAILYDDPEFGRVVVIQHRADMTLQEFEESARDLVAMSGDMNVHGSFEFLEIRGGHSALLTNSPDGKESTIFWYENGIEFIVRGPQVDRTAVLEISEGL